MGKTNADIVTVALRGGNATASGGNMSTDHYRGDFSRWGAPFHGYLPARLRDRLDEVFRAGRISQVIYSYSTPIAWKDGDVWIIPDVRYSVITSTKHQTHLYRLRGQYIPADAGSSEYAQVLAGATVYTPGQGYRGSEVK